MAQVKAIKTTALPPLEEWQVAVMRITAFPAAPIQSEVSWWADLVGYPPETVVSRPKASQYQAEGEFERRRLALQVQLDRVDWHLAPIVKLSGEEIPGTVPLAGPFPEVVGSLAKIAERWLPVSPRLARLAFGAVLVQPTEDRRSGYVRIEKYLLGVTLDPDGSSDFLYQINRPRPSRVGIKNLRINRLMKWSVLLFQQFSVTLDKEGIRTVGLPPGDTACRLELDINTAPDFEGALPADKLPAIWQELIDLGREIAERGDIP